MKGGTVSRVVSTVPLWCIGKFWMRSQSAFRPIQGVHFVSENYATVQCRSFPTILRQPWSFTEFCRRLRTREFNSTSALQEAVNISKAATFTAFAKCKQLPGSGAKNFNEECIDLHWIDGKEGKCFQLSSKIQISNLGADLFTSFPSSACHLLQPCPSRMRHPSGKYVWFDCPLLAFQTATWLTWSPSTSSSCRRHSDSPTSLGPSPFSSYSRCHFYTVFSEWAFCKVRRIGKRLLGMKVWWKQLAIPILMASSGLLSL